MWDKIFLDETYQRMYLSALVTFLVACFITAFRGGTMRLDILGLLGAAVALCIVLGTIKRRVGETSYWVAWVAAIGVALLMWMGK